MYAILIRLDDDVLQIMSLEEANQTIREVLEEHGFNWQQGSPYFGGERINAVTCVLAATDLARRLPWFATSVRDIRMLRIEELNDLMPAVRAAVTQHGG